MNKIITSEGNVQFVYDGGKIINVHPFHVYTQFNVDTISFILIAMPKNSGLAIFSTEAEDLEVDGQVYSFDSLPNVLSEAFSNAGAQAKAEIVDELPSSGKTNTMYLVPKDSSGFDEYIYINEKWELIGDTDIELSRYATKDDLYLKQDKLISGTNIKTINGESILGEGNIDIETNVDSYTKEESDERYALKSELPNFTYNNITKSLEIN